jgi:hypothetical protein
MGDSIIHTKRRIGNDFSQAVISDLGAAERILSLVRKTAWPFNLLVG